MSDTNSEGTLPSGRFVLRIEPGLHAALRESARESGTSLNDYCARKLASPGGNVVGPAAEAVERAAAMMGDALLGIVAFGSWAREEMADASDVDLLIVVEPRVAIVRDLYRRWDTSPLFWGGRHVEVHFVHFPESGSSVSGLWAEAALDGVVLFERGLVESRRLGKLRRRIVGAGMFRRRSHGQPYWVGGR